MRGILLAPLCWFLALASVSAQKISIQFPTKNDALLRGDLAAFYMPTDLTSKPPESGSWGFVRNVREISGSRVYTRFHEGIDIKPLTRDSRSIPTDRVMSIGKGRVVYVNPVSSRSNYGNYVVVEHQDWGYGPICSLYAHLASTQVEIGQQVQAGTVLGVLGSTGAGLNNARAHVHLEIGIVMRRSLQ